MEPSKMDILKNNMDILYIVIILIISIFGFIFNTYNILINSDTQDETKVAIMVAVAFVGLVVVPLYLLLWRMLPDDKFGCVE